MLVAALAAGVLLAGGSLRAGETNTPPAGAPPAGERGPGMRGARPDFAKALDLTDDQKPKFEAIMTGSMEKMRALRQDTSLTPEDRRAKAKTIQDDRNTQVKALLTPEQYAKYEKMAQGMRRNGPPGGGAPGAGAGGGAAGGDHPAPPAGLKQN